MTVQFVEKVITGVLMLNVFQRIQHAIFIQTVEIRVTNWMTQTSFQLGLKIIADTKMVTVFGTHLGVMGMIAVKITIGGPVFQMSIDVKLDGAKIRIICEMGEVIAGIRGTSMQTPACVALLLIRSICKRMVNAFSEMQIVM